MHAIQWDEALSVGVPEIDEQHKHLFSVLHALQDAMNQGKGTDVLEEVVAELLRYSQTHFDTEYRYFDQYDYPDAKKHRAEHEEFIRKVDEFRAQYFQKGKLVLSVEILQFLSHWLKTHIKGSDQAYIPYLREHGLK